MAVKIGLLIANWCEEEYFDWFFREIGFVRVVESPPTPWPIQNKIDSIHSINHASHTTIRSIQRDYHQNPISNNSQQRICAISKDDPNCYCANKCLWQIFMPKYWHKDWNENRHTTQNERLNRMSMLMMTTMASTISKSIMCDVYDGWHNERGEMRACCQAEMIQC